jgi:hypothetical protein
MSLLLLCCPLCCVVGAAGDEYEEIFLGTDFFFGGISFYQFTPHDSAIVRDSPAPCRSHSPFHVPILLTAAGAGGAASESSTDFQYDSFTDNFAGAEGVL